MARVRGAECCFVFVLLLAAISKVSALCTCAHGTVDGTAACIANEERCLVGTCTGIYMDSDISGINNICRCPIDGEPLGPSHANALDDNCISDCTCANGVVVAQTAATCCCGGDHCASCTGNYALLDNVYPNNQCTLCGVGEHADVTNTACIPDCQCTNGTPFVGASCPTGNEGCETCANAWEKAGGTNDCVQKVCTCSDGTPATTTCTVETENCSACPTAGFMLSVSVPPTCITAVCTCTNGAAFAGSTNCATGTEGCEICTNNWEHENGTDTCVQNICQCSTGQSGDEATGTDCTVHNGDICTSCSTPGQHLNGIDCVNNVCSCPNGQEAIGAACINHNDVICTGCTGNYHLNTATNDTCVANRCVCAGGTFVADALCTLNGDNQCASCTSATDHVDANGDCVANVCTCSNGTPISPCAVHGTAQCTTCNNGFLLRGIACLPGDDCVVSTIYGSCNTECGTTGTRIAARTITTAQFAAGNACPPLIETVPCASTHPACGACSTHQCNQAITDLGWILNTNATSVICDTLICPDAVCCHLDPVLYAGKTSCAGYDCQLGGLFLNETLRDDALFHEYAPLMHTGPAVPYDCCKDSYQYWAQTHMPVFFEKIQLAHLVAVAIYFLLLILGILQLKKMFKIQSKAMASYNVVLTQHVIIVFLSIFRIVAAMQYAHLIHISGWTVGLVIALPYMLVYWCFTLLVAQYGSIYHMGMKHGSASFKKVRPFFIGTNIAIMVIVFGIFIGMSTSNIDEEMKEFIAIGGSIILCCIQIASGTLFYIYASLLSKTLIGVGQRITEEKEKDNADESRTKKSKRNNVNTATSSAASQMLIYSKIVLVSFWGQGIMIVAAMVLDEQDADGLLDPSPTAESDAEEKTQAIIIGLKTLFDLMAMFTIMAIYNNVLVRHYRKLERMKNSSDHSSDRAIRSGRSQSDQKQENSQVSKVSLNIQSALDKIEALEEDDIETGDSSSVKKSDDPVVEADEDDIDDIIGKALDDQENEKNANEKIAKGAMELVDIVKKDDANVDAANEETAKEKEESAKEEDAKEDSTKADDDKKEESDEDKKEEDTANKEEETAEKEKETTEKEDDSD